LDITIKIRGQDRWGAGHYGAPRSGRRHQGIDIVVHRNEAVTAYDDGKITKIGYPYNPDDAKKGHLRYLEVTVSNGDRHRYFYVDAFFTVGDLVERGDIIGYAQGLSDVYPGITQHYHWEVMKPGRGRSYREPVEVLTNLGYEVE